MNTRLIRYHQSVLYPLLIAACMLMHTPAHADFIHNVPAGPIDFIQLDARPNNMITARFSAGGRRDLIITYETPALSIFSNEIHTTVELEYVISLIKPLRKTDTTDLIACIPVNKNEVHVLRFDPQEKILKKHWSKELSNPVYMLHTADVSNDGHDDLLLLLQDRPGVGIMQNNGDGTFREIEFLFDDILVSLFQVVDLNGDGINDFILYDPIQNVLRFHYGFGRMIFSLERYHALPAALNYFHALTIVEDAIHDMVAAFPDAGEFRVYLGDGLGRFTHIQTRSLSSRTHTFLFTDLFDNKRPDLVIAERETGLLRLYRNNYQRGYEPAGYLMLPRGVRGITARKNSETGQYNLYVLDIENSRLIVIGLLPSVMEYLPHKLALASGATDMVAANLFGGELPELYVLCKDSGTISVYWYDRSFRLNHSMISLPGNPDNLYVHRGPKDRMKLVISDKESDLITIVSIRWDRLDANVYGIPAMAGSDIIHLGLTPDGKFQFGMLVFAAQTNIPTLSLFEQIGSDEYIERTITPVQEGGMLALDVVDITGNDMVDIVYMFREENEKEVYITSALNDSAYVFRRQGDTLTLEDSTATRGFLISESMPWKQSTSFIGYLDEHGKKNGRLFRIRGDSDGLLSLLSSNSGNKIITSPNDIFVLQSRTGSFNDIVFYNALTERIEIVYSKEDGSFMPPKPIKRVDDLSAFTVYSEPIGEVHMLVIGRKGKSYVEISRIEE